jgi:hypothetical protein
MKDLAEDLELVELPLRVAAVDFVSPLLPQIFSPRLCVESLCYYRFLEHCKLHYNAVLLKSSQTTCIIMQFLVTFSPLFCLILMQINDLAAGLALVELPLRVAALAPWFSVTR